MTAISEWTCPVLEMQDRQVLALLREWRKNHEVIVSTNGCFDILHPGHLYTLAYAREQGTRLVVGVDTDLRVREMKGTGRPAVPLEVRTAILSYMRMVDLVVVMEDIVDFVEMIKPDIHVKGGDYVGQRMREADMIISNGGRIVLASYLPGLSTTNLLRGIRERGGFG